MVIIDFWAPWCVPCEKVSPIVEALAAEYPALRVRALDVDAHPVAAARHAVLSLPTLILFRDGAEVERLLAAGRRGFTAGDYPLAAERLRAVLALRSL